MNGPEHYAKAEQLLGLLPELTRVLDSESKARTLSAAGAQAASSLMNGVVAEAQVHATLALTAATIQSQVGDLNGTWGKTIRGASS